MSSPRAVPTSDSASVMAEAAVTTLLRDLGANDIDADAVGSGAASAPSIARLRARIDAERQRTERTIDETTQSPAFAQLSRTGKELVTRLKTLDDSATALETELSHEQTGLLTLLVAGLSQHSAIASAAAKGQAQLDAALALDSCHRAVSELATLVEAGQLRTAVDRLGPITELLERTTPDWIRATTAWQAEKAWFDRLRATTHDRLIAAQEAAIKLGEGRLAVLPTVATSSDGAHRMALADVLAALQTLAPTALTSSVSKLGAEIVRQLVSPALAKSRSFVARNENGLDVIELSADGSSPSAPRTLVVLLDFFAAHLLAASPILAAALPSLLAPSIQSLTIEHALAPALPDTLSTTALAIFQTRLDDALALEAAMDRSGLFGGATDAPRSIRRWVERAGEHWAERRASVASKALRSLIVRMDWEAVVVDWREPKPSVLRQAGTFFSRYS